MYFGRVRLTNAGVLLYERTWPLLLWGGAASPSLALGNQDTMRRVLAVYAYDSDRVLYKRDLSEAKTSHKLEASSAVRH